MARGDPVLRTDLAPHGFFVAAGFGSVRAAGPKMRLEVVYFEHGYGLLPHSPSGLSSPEQKSTVVAAFEPKRSAHHCSFMYPRTARSS